jgi:hypothetical protein
MSLLFFHTRVLNHFLPVLFSHNKITLGLWTNVEYKRIIKEDRV